MRGDYDSFHWRLIGKALSTRFADCAEAGIDAGAVYAMLSRDAAHLENARRLSDYYSGILAEVQKRTANIKQNGN